MKAFIKYLHEGILGTVSAYYECVEAQGQGTLHCYMMIWLEGGLNPNEIKDRILQSKEQSFKDRLLQYLEDTILTCIPELPKEDVSIPNQTSHPCSTQGVDFQNTTEDNFLTDPETGEITLKCLDGLVNHFNESILEAMRCNTDIKFIGSGPAAKAILYYITNYITKSQLKTHVALAAMETAKMLQKCAHSMISHQELSAQQACSYLMDFEDHFTSHEYQGLYWTNFESFVEKCSPNHTDHETEKMLDGSDDELNQGYVERTLDDDGVYVEQLENDEIRIGSDSFGNLVPKAAQVMDYLH
ncbi:uncharacterized protein HD556DRAFT_1430667 [Suillus plorans]|uniref:Helitron helicase-like domain-containing protein n=1 Tax=Suillus plorans TaxID=116603 RepID=A0A9P7J2C0_9AGAM|nr:uncharacterized protein HD556DRAFT_1430667 [Suillus plorans]KAG1799396.1 hypothetical protein HD556DRAFT_1430667 [Suillus plorans]